MCILPLLASLSVWDAAITWYPSALKCTGRERSDPWDPLSGTFWLSTQTLSLKSDFLGSPSPAKWKNILHHSRLCLSETKQSYHFVPQQECLSWTHHSLWPMELLAYQEDSRIWAGKLDSGNQVPSIGCKEPLVIGRIAIYFLAICYCLGWETPEENCPASPRGDCIRAS